jgi:hypothetical protein
MKRSEGAFGVVRGGAPLVASGGEAARSRRPERAKAASHEHRGRARVSMGHRYLAPGALTADPRSLGASRAGSLPAWASEFMEESFIIRSLGLGRRRITCPAPCRKHARTHSKCTVAVRGRGKKKRKRYRLWRGICPTPSRLEPRSPGLSRVSLDAPTTTCAFCYRSMERYQLGGWHTLGTPGQLSIPLARARPGCDADPQTVWLLCT